MFLKVRKVYIYNFFPALLTFTLPLYGKSAAIRNPLDSLNYVLKFFLLFDDKKLTIFSLTVI